MSSQARRICFGITELDQGGAERALVQIVTRLDRDRWSPHVICLAKRGALVDDLEQAHFPVTCLNATPSKNPFAIRSLVKKFRSVLVEHEAEILQTFLFHANIVGRFAASRTKVTRTLAGIRVAEKRSRWPLLLDRWTQNRVDQNVCVSESVARFSIEEGKLDPDKVVVIPNGVDATEFENAEPADLTKFEVSPGSRVILFVGRIDEQKDPIKLVDAFETAVTQVQANTSSTPPKIELLFVGQGNLEQQLRQRVNQSPLQGQIHLAGWQPNIPQIMKAATLFVLPSRWEGMPNVALEAGAAGLPVISTDVEGVREVIPTDEFGLVVEAGSTTALRQAIVACLTNPNEALARASRLQNFIKQHFTWNQVVEQYEKQFFLL